MLLDLTWSYYCSSGAKSSSVEGLQNWNPFADDGDSISDDVMFGQEFDRLRCGSESSIQNVKSREDLVMLENGNHGDGASDPFSAAPFYHKSKGWLGHADVYTMYTYSSVLSIFAPLAVSFKICELGLNLDTLQCAANLTQLRSSLASKFGTFFLVLDKF